ncbi:MAG: phytanoyl-CoA dioxygenase family protein [Acidimicrobiales bacterium]
MAVRPLTDEEVATYRAEGVVKLPGFVDGSLVAEMLDALDHRMANPGPYGYTNLYTQDRCFALDYPVLRRYVLDPTLGQNAARAMNSERARFFFDHLFAFAPQTVVEDHYWHQDQPYWPVQGEQIVSFWLALTPCTPETSALKFVSGSHRAERCYPPLGFDGQPLRSDLGPLADQAVDVRDQFLDSQPPPYHLDPAANGVIEFGYEPGDAVMFHTKLVHSSGGNSSPDARRVAYSIRSIGDDATMILRQGVFQDPALLPDPDEVFEVGAPMVSRRWPVVHG